MAIRDQWIDTYQAGAIIAGPMGPMGPAGKIDKSLVDYVDILFNLMGVDITYEKFQSMTDAERKQFVRNIKLSKIINEEKK